MVYSLGFRDFWFTVHRVHGLGIYGLQFRVHGLGFMGHGSWYIWLRVWGSWFRVQGSLVTSWLILNPRITTCIDCVLLVGQSSFNITFLLYR